MSLTDKSKQGLRAAIEGPIAILGPAARNTFVKLGPAKIVQGIIESSQIPEAVRLLTESRAEAEQYVAGLLGMM